MKLEVIVQPVFFKNGLDLYVVQRGIEGPAAVAEPLTMTTVKDGSVCPAAPTMFLPMIAAQSLMDSLYAAGLRPSEARKGNDALAASGRHIDDLRRVAFTLLDRTPKVSP